MTNPESNRGFTLVEVVVALAIVAIGMLAVFKTISVGPNPTWVEAGRALAERVMKANPTEEARLTEAFRRVCARPPAAGDLKILHRSLDRARRRR